VAVKPTKAGGFLAALPSPGSPAQWAEQARAAIEDTFGGDAPLFRAYAASALEQFPHDAATGDRAVAASDRPLLMRTAHNLKSVLAMLGDAAWSGHARTLEHAAEANEADWASLAQMWGPLRDEVLRRAQPADGWI
jgi:HPt (histidine-containing phosphotransfer) domain-containing protein